MSTNSNQRVVQEYLENNARSAHVNVYDLCGYIEVPDSCGLVEPVFSDRNGNLYIQEVDEWDVVTEILELSDEYQSNKYIKRISLPPDQCSITFAFGSATYMFVQNNIVWWGARHNALQFFNKYTHDHEIDATVMLDLAVFAGVSMRECEELIRKVAKATASDRADDNYIRQYEKTIQSQISMQVSERWYRPDLWQARDQITGSWEADAKLFARTTENDRLKHALVSVLTNINTGWRALAAVNQRKIERAIRGLYFSICLLDQLIDGGRRTDDRYEASRQDHAALYNARLSCCTLYAFCVTLNYLRQNHPASLSRGENIFGFIDPYYFTKYLHSSPDVRLICLFDMLATLSMPEKSPLKPGLLGIGTVVDASNRDRDGMIMHYDRQEVRVPPSLIAPQDYLDPPPDLGSHRFFSGTKESFGEDTVSCRGKDYVPSAFQVFFPIKEHFPETEFIMAASNSVLIVVIQRKVFSQLLSASAINKHVRQIESILQIRRIVIVEQEERDEYFSEKLIKAFCRSFYKKARPDLSTQESIVRIDVEPAHTSNYAPTYDQRKLRTFAAALSKLIERFNFNLKTEIWLRGPSKSSKLWLMPNSLADDGTQSKTSAIYFIGPKRPKLYQAIEIRENMSLMSRSATSVGHITESNGAAQVVLSSGHEELSSTPSDQEMIEIIFKHLAA